MITTAERSTVSTLAAGETISATAVCPAGTTLVGGGFADDQPDEGTDVVYSGPDGSNGWLVKLHNEGGSSVGPVDVEAIARCASLSGDGGSDPVDADNDGYTADVDCDDSDPAVNPGATEVVGDGIDNDCDDVVE